MIQNIGILISSKFMLEVDWIVFIHYLPFNRLFWVLSGEASYLHNVKIFILVYLS